MRENCPNLEFLLVFYFSAFRLNAEIYKVNLHLQSDYWKIRARKNSKFGQFHAFFVLTITSTLVLIINFCNMLNESEVKLLAFQLYICTCISVHLQLYSRCTHEAIRKLWTRHFKFHNMKRFAQFGSICNIKKT